MALLKIARMGHPVLRRPAAAVADPTAPEIARLLADMEETMADAGGVGLAATQVHVPLRVILFRVPAARADSPAADAAEGGPVPLTRLINPEIEPLGDEQVLGWEACLSVPGLTGRVPRSLRIRYRGLAPDGTPIDRVAVGFHARVVQHEVDHLDGILYPQRMRDLSTFAFVDEMQRSRVAVSEGAAAVDAKETQR
ncbi:MAG: peptide deformylase [Rhodospirillales bacterium]